MSQDRSDPVVPIRIHLAEEPHSEDYGELMKEFGLNQDKSKSSWLCFGGGARNFVFRLLDTIDPDMHPVTRILGANTDTQQFSEMFQEGTKKPRYLHKWAKRVKDYGFRMLPLGNEGGAGRNPEIARVAVEAVQDEIRKSYEGSRISILVANLGGGTGSGAAPVMARYLAEKKEEMGSLAVLMTPFGYEGEMAFARAQEALKGVTEHIPALVIRNQALYEIKPDSRYKKLVQDLKDADTGRAIDIANEYGLAPIIYALDRLIMHAASSVNRDPKDFKKLMRSGKTAYVGIYQSEEEGAPTDTQEIVEQLLNNPFLAKGIVERAKIGMVLFEGFKYEDTGYIANEIIAEMKGGDDTKQIELMPGHDSGEPGKRSIFFIAVAEEEPNFETLINPEGTARATKIKRRVVLAGGRAIPQHEESSPLPVEELVPREVCLTPIGTRDKKVEERNFPIELAKRIASFVQDFKKEPEEIRKGEWNIIRKEARPYLESDEEMTELQPMTFQNENQTKIYWFFTPILHERYRALERRVDAKKKGDREGAQAEFQALSEAFKEETGHSLHPNSSTLFKNLLLPESKQSGFGKLWR